MTTKRISKIISFLLCFLLIFEQSGFAQMAVELNISGHLLSLNQGFIQDKFRPLHLRYLSFDQTKDTFKLLLDKGDVKDLNSALLESTSKTLLKYFLIGIALPNESFWVNLRPDGEDNIIDDSLSRTDIGKILLEADVELKKDTAKLTSPQTPEGKAYWDRLYKKAGELFGSDNISIPTLTRPWIVPGEIILRENKTSAYIYKATFKVMLEQDYLNNSDTYSFKDPRLKILNEYSSELIRELIIPKLTKEVNSSRRYSELRQVYYSLIMAQWFKSRFRNTQGKLTGIIDRRDISKLTSKTFWSKATYFKQYQKSFKDGEYNIKEPVQTLQGQSIRSYFSGGIQINPVVPEVGAVSPGTSGEMTAAVTQETDLPANPNLTVLQTFEVGDAGETTLTAALPADKIAENITKSFNEHSGITIGGRLFRFTAQRQFDLVQVYLLDESGKKMQESAVLEFNLKRNMISRFIDNEELRGAGLGNLLASLLSSSLPEGYTINSFIINDATRKDLSRNIEQRNGELRILDAAQLDDSRLARTLKERGLAGKRIVREVRAPNEVLAEDVMAATIIGRTFSNSGFGGFSLYGVDQNFQRSSVGYDAFLEYISRAKQEDLSCGIGLTAIKMALRETMPGQNTPVGAEVVSTGYLASSQIDIQSGITQTYEVGLQYAQAKGDFVLKGLDLQQIKTLARQLAQAEYGEQAQTLISSLKALGRTITMPQAQSIIATCLGGVRDDQLADAQAQAARLSMGDDVRSEEYLRRLESETVLSNESKQALLFLESNKSGGGITINDRRVGFYSDEAPYSEVKLGILTGLIVLDQGKLYFQPEQKRASLYHIAKLLQFLEDNKRFYESGSMVREEGTNSGVGINYREVKLGILSGFITFNEQSNNLVLKHGKSKMDIPAYQFADPWGRQIIVTIGQLESFTNAVRARIRSRTVSDAAERERLEKIAEQGFMSVIRRVSLAQEGDYFEKSGSIFKVAKVQLDVDSADSNRFRFIYTLNQIYPQVNNPINIYGNDVRLYNPITQERALEIQDEDKAQRLVKTRRDLEVRVAKYEEVVINEGRQYGPSIIDPVVEECLANGFDDLAERLEILKLKILDMERVHAEYRSRLTVLGKKVSDFIITDTQVAKRELMLIETEMDTIQSALAADAGHKVIIKLYMDELVKSYEKLEKIKNRLKKQEARSIVTFRHLGAVNPGVRKSESADVFCDEENSVYLGLGNTVLAVSKDSFGFYIVRVAADNSELGRRVYMNSPSLDIGRDESTGNISIGGIVSTANIDKGISRQHVRIEILKDNQIRITDLGSHFGTDYKSFVDDLIFGTNNSREVENLARNIGYYLDHSAEGSAARVISEFPDDAVRLNIEVALGFRQGNKEKAADYLFNFFRKYGVIFIFSENSILLGKAQGYFPIDYRTVKRVVLVDPIYQKGFEDSLGFYASKLETLTEGYVILDHSRFADIDDKVIAVHEARHAFDFAEQIEIRRLGRVVNFTLQEREYTAYLAMLLINNSTASYQVYRKMYEAYRINHSSTGYANSNIAAQCRIIEEFLTRGHYDEYVTDENIKMVAKELIEAFYNTKFGYVPSYPDIWKAAVVNIAQVLPISPAVISSSSGVAQTYRQGLKFIQINRDSFLHDLSAQQIDALAQRLARAEYGEQAQTLIDYLATLGRTITMPQAQSIIVTCLGGVRDDQLADAQAKVVAVSPRMQIIEQIKNNQPITVEESRSLVLDIFDSPSILTLELLSALSMNRATLTVINDAVRGYGDELLHFNPRFKELYRNNINDNARMLILLLLLEGLSLEEIESRLKKYDRDILQNANHNYAAADKTIRNFLKGYDKGNGPESNDVITTAVIFVTLCNQLKSKPGSAEGGMDSSSNLPNYTGSGNSAIHLALDAARKMIANQSYEEAEALLKRLIGDLEAARHSQRIDDLMDEWDSFYPSGVDLLIEDIPAAIRDAQELLSQLVAAKPVIDASSSSKDATPYTKLVASEFFLSAVMRTWEKINEGSSSDPVELTDRISGIIPELENAGIIVLQGNESKLSLRHNRTVLAQLNLPFEEEEKLIECIDLLAENIRQHAYNFGVLLLFVDKEKSKLSIAMVDKGRGFPVMDIETKEPLKQLRRKDGKIVRLQTTKHGVALSAFILEVNKMMVFSAGHIFFGSNLARLDGQHTALLSGSVVLAEINLPSDNPAENPDVSRVGGIDFRSLPIVVQAMNNLKANINSLSRIKLMSVNLNNEWNQIEKMADSGITPSTQRIKEYLQASCLKGSAFNDKNKIISCIADILRRQEEGFCITEPALRDILVVLESSNSIQDLKQSFIGS